MADSKIQVELDVKINAPDDWTAEQIKQFQEMYAALHAFKPIDYSATIQIDRTALIPELVKNGMISLNEAAQAMGVDLKEEIERKQAAREGDYYFVEWPALDYPTGCRTYKPGDRMRFDMTASRGLLLTEVSATMSSRGGPHVPIEVGWDGEHFYHEMTTPSEPGLYTVRWQALGAVCWDTIAVTNMDDPFFAKKEEKILPPSVSEGLQKMLESEGEKMIKWLSETRLRDTHPYGVEKKFEGEPHIPSTILVRGVEMEACKCGIVRADCDIHRRA